MMNGIFRRAPKLDDPAYRSSLDKSFVDVYTDRRLEIKLVVFFVKVPFVRRVNFFENIFDVIRRSIAAAYSGPFAPLTLQPASAKPNRPLIPVYTGNAVHHIAPVLVMKGMQDTGLRIGPLAFFIVKLPRPPFQMLRASGIAFKIPLALPKRIRKIPVRKTPANHTPVVAEKLVGSLTVKRRPSQRANINTVFIQFPLSVYNNTAL